MYARAAAAQWSRLFEEEEERRAASSECAQTEGAFRRPPSAVAPRRTSTTAHYSQAQTATFCPVTATLHSLPPALLGDQSPRPILTAILSSTVAA